MTEFFYQMDKIYCLCIQERLEFVKNQCDDLGITNIVTIVNACTPNDVEFDKTIANHQVYPVYTEASGNVALTIGITKIMQDIVKNKFKYVMIIEDDVLFLKENFPVANKWLTQKSISEKFNVNLPYCLYLQTSFPCDKYNYANSHISFGNILYGNPAYITNYNFCELLLKNMFPITSPYDEYKIAIKTKYSVQQGLLVPYICKELSLNFTGYKDSKINTIFNRTVNAGTIVPILLNKCFYIETTNIGVNSQNHLDLIHFIINHLNKDLRFEINSNVPLSVKKYKMDYIDGDQKNYIYGATINDLIIMHPESFVITVNGKNSQNILEKKYGVKPLIGNLLLLTSRIYKKNYPNQYKYCYIYDNILPQTNDRAIGINTKSNIADILDAITQSEYIITNNIDYIMIAHSYGIRAVLYVHDISEYELNKIIIDDYYSTFSDNKNPIALFLNINDWNVDENLINTLPQLNSSITKEYLDKMINICPFNIVCHGAMVENDLYAQIY